MTELFAVFAAVLGAVAGSFLNACIHRMPRGVGLLEPRRSFCPSCGKTIPWWENLPVLSWILLRGKCSSCGSSIPFRYLLVEILTAVLFLWLWLKFGSPLAPAYFSFAALLVAATFIDLEHFIIPDEITLGGTALGVLLCVAIPDLMETGSRVEALGLSLIGAVAGFSVVFLIVELGKLAFGKICHKFPVPEEFEWRRDGDTASLRIGKDTMDWGDIFSRPKDNLVVLFDGQLDCDGQPLSGGRLDFYHDRALIQGETRSLMDIGCISGRISSITIPREAMGFGDVKFMACIGAFLGWQGVLFTLFAASVVGSLVGLAGFFLARDRAGVRLPFGPFLAVGALIWLFGGRALIDWYFLALASAGGRVF